ncbi:hypothetical protein BC941DRAFT_234307 [Chlamydoabsidia padenii]|nr:hypothetical protein BC941DRAFT_234307 [Chlamydoabsidia padenii]
MDMDNSDHDYATIPLERLPEFEELFRSYLGHHTNIVNIMLELFINEVEHNYTFWLELMKRCHDFIIPLPSLQNNTDQQEQTFQVTLGHLLGYKFHQVYNKSVDDTYKETLLHTLYYVSALLIKEDMVLMRHLVQYIDFNIKSSWYQFVGALFSVGQFHNVLSLLRNCKDGRVVDKSFYSNVHCMVDSLMDTWLEKIDIPVLLSSTVIQQQQQSKKSNKTLLGDGSRRIGFYFDSESESDTDTDTGHENNSTSASTFSTVQSGGNNSKSMMADHAPYSLYDIFSQKYIYDIWKMPSGNCTNSTKIQLLNDCLMPCFSILDCKTVNKAAISVNKFIVLLHSTLLSTQDNNDRALLLQMLTRFVLQALPRNPSIDVYDCMMSALTVGERYQSYLSWRNDCSSKNRNTSQGSGDKAKQDFKILLDHDEPNYHNVSKMALTLLRSHPNDIADHVIHEMQFNYNMTFGKRQFIGDLYTNPSSKLALDILAARIATKIVSTRSMIFDQQKENKQRVHKLPESIHLLCVFVRYLFKERHVDSEPLYQYLSLYLPSSSSSSPPLLEQRSHLSSLPWFFTASFVQFVCARTNEYIYHVNKNNQRKVTSTAASPSAVPKKQSSRVLGDLYSNKKQCLRMV